LLALATASLSQSNDDFDAQLQLGDVALQRGLADAALSAGDAAVRDEPEKWNGYALSGRALLALKRYEMAADALSRAIERAPAAEQPALRELRRQSLLAEAGGPAPSPAPLARAAPVAPAPPVPPQAAPTPGTAAVAAAPAAPAPAARVARRGRKSAFGIFSSDSPDAVWTDSAGLTWARPWYYPSGQEGPFDFPQAQALCAGLTLAGQQDWRLPTVDEVKRIYQVSSKTFRFSAPKFDPDYGLNEALKRDAWQVHEFTVDGDEFNGNRVLIWSSTAGDQPGRHEAVYFGRVYSVDDNVKIGSKLHGTVRRSPFHAYALCVRGGQDQASG